MLLWHGSRLTNWVGILSKGLRIAPPEAPVTGYMVGAPREFLEHWVLLVFGNIFFTNGHIFKQNVVKNFLIEIFST